MSAPEPARTPVILAIGEVIHRPVSTAEALEPVELMAKALREAEADADGAALISQIDSLDLVAQITWPYADPVGRLCALLGVAPTRTVNESMGGETPVRLLHEAALRIALGDSQLCAIVGGEAMHALAAAKKAGVMPDWTPPAAPEDVVKVAGSRLAISPSSKRLGVTSPAQLYPLYENASQAALGQTPTEGRAASAALWARYAAVAAENPYAWLRDAPSAQEIAAVSERNRLIAWPYPKLMTANPLVNQASAILVTSLARARDMGLDDGRLVFFRGGAAAREEPDYLHRDRYDHSTAQAAVLDRAIDLAGGSADAFDFAELYSCFPVVPKMAAQSLKLSADVPPTVAGGLTFFGGPFNNFMSHAACAMVRRLREKRSALGLLYGQGGFVDKHHALLLGSTPPAQRLNDDYSVQMQAEAARGPTPPMTEDHEGPARVETFTVLYDRKGAATQGVVIARTPDGARLLATVEPQDAASIARLTDLDRSAIGAEGVTRLRDGGDLVWSLRPQ